MTKSVSVSSPSEGSSSLADNMANVSETSVLQLKEQVAYLNGQLEAQRRLYQEQLLQLRAERDDVVKEKNMMFTKVCKLEAHLELQKQSSGDNKGQFIDRLGQMKEVHQAEPQIQTNSSSQQKRQVALELEHSRDEQEESSKYMMEPDEKVQSWIQQEPSGAELKKHKSSKVSLSLEKTVTTKKAVPPNLWWKISRSSFWNFSGIVVDTMDGVMVESGIYTWKIRVSEASYTTLGVLSPAHQRYDMKLGRFPGSWGYDDTGGLYRGSYYFSGNAGRYNSKDDDIVITFTLDLTERGHLDASINNLPPVRLFYNMKDFASSFIPAVSFSSETTESYVEILD